MYTAEGHILHFRYLNPASCINAQFKIQDARGKSAIYAHAEYITGI